jgi:uncharacterized protein (TIGR02145 family)
MTREKLVDIDGIEYKSIRIGKFVWMAENLRTSHFLNGDQIPCISETYIWGAATKSLCSPISGDGLNRFYNWHAVMDERGLAPKGWRIPSRNDWHQLAIHLGGDKVAGGKLKKDGLKEWDAPNEGASNSSGFGALPYGTKGIENASNLAFGMWATFWTSDKALFGKAHYSILSSSSISLGKNTANIKYGLSIRCIQDA